MGERNIGNVYVTINFVAQVEVREYLDSAGGSPFGNWFAGLNAVAAAKITVAVSRLEAGNFSNVKGVAPAC